MERFAGKVAVVTGAGRGIGEACAEAFAAEGASVAVVDRDADVAEAVAKAITARGHIATAMTADVSSAADAERVIEATVGTYGGLDVLMNNAGIQRYGTVEDTPEEVWDAVLNINLKGAFLMSKYAIPHLRARGGGAIVNTASVQAFASQAGVAAYSASKGGLVSLTKTMALDHAKEGIRVNAIAPGSVRTPMLEWAAELFVPEDPTGAIEEWGAGHPIGHVTEPSDVANLVLFLASPDARCITGATYPIDGGLLAKIGI